MISALEQSLKLMLLRDFIKDRMVLIANDCIDIFSLFLEMLIVLITIIIATLITFIFLKPLIDNFLYPVPDEPKYIHSYVPFLGFGRELFKDPIGFIRSLYQEHGKIFSISISLKRWVYMYDEQTYLTKVLKSPDLSIDDFLIDLMVDAVGINRECLTNEDVQQMTQKQFHQYLVGDELEFLNKRVHDSLIKSMKHDKKIVRNDSTRTVNFFDFISEFMLYAGCDGLFGPTFTNEQRDSSANFYKLYQDFDRAFQLGVIRLPFRRFLYQSVFKNQLKFINKFSSLKLNNDESQLIQIREEMYRSDQFKHIFRDYDIAAVQSSLLFVAVGNTAPLSCWSVIDLLLHPEALEAVRQELKENLSMPTAIYEKETLAKLNVLDSCINESIRRIANSTSTRQAVRNTTVECIDKTKIGLRKGDMLIYPAFVKHFDPNLFGPNPYEYQYDRFVRKPDQPKAPSIMYFGCGTHMCPGRYWAINEIKILVALIIQHMDVEFVNMTEQDKEAYRKRQPYDYSKLVFSSGPRKDSKHKFDIRYSYRNLDNA